MTNTIDDEKLSVNAVTLYMSDDASSTVSGYVLPPSTSFTLVIIISRPSNSNSSKSAHTSVIVGSIIGVILALALLLVAALLWWRRRRPKVVPENTTVYPWRPSFTSTSSLQNIGLQDPSCQKPPLYEPVPMNNLPPATVRSSENHAGQLDKSSTNSRHAPSRLHASNDMYSRSPQPDASTRTGPSPNNLQASDHASTVAIQQPQVSDSSMQQFASSLGGPPGGQASPPPRQYQEVDIDQIIELVAQRLDPRIDSRHDRLSGPLGPPPQYPS